MELIKWRNPSYLLDKKSCSKRNLSRCIDPQKILERNKSDLLSPKFENKSRWEEFLDKLINKDSQSQAGLRKKKDFQSFLLGQEQVHKGYL